MLWTPRFWRNELGSMLTFVTELDTIDWILSNAVRIPITPTTATLRQMLTQRKRKRQGVCRDLQVNEETKALGVYERTKLFTVECNVRPATLRNNPILSHDSAECRIVKLKVTTHAHGYIQVQHSPWCWLSDVLAKSDYTLKRCSPERFSSREQRIPGAFANGDRGRLERTWEFSLRPPTTCECGTMQTSIRLNSAVPLGPIKRRVNRLAQMHWSLVEVQW